VRRSKQSKKPVPKQAVTRLQDLPIYNVLLEKLLSGVSCNQLAGWIKGQGFFPDVNTEALRKALDRLRRAEQRAHPPLAPTLSNPVPQPVTDDGAVEIKETKLLPPEIAALEELAMLQQDRINLLHDNERKIKHLFPQGRGEVAELRAILHTLLDKKRELGTPGYGGPQQPAPERGGDVNLTLHVGQLTQQTMTVLGDPGSRRRVLDALRALGTKGDLDRLLLKKRLGDNVLSEAGLLEDGEKKEPVTVVVAGP
jgi:hypothetical protein